MNTFSYDLFCVFILLQMLYVIQSGTRFGPLGFTSEELKSLGEESLNKTVGDSDNDDSNQDLTPKSKEYENNNKKSGEGRCSIQINR